MIVTRARRTLGSLRLLALVGRVTRMLRRVDGELVDLLDPAGWDLVGMTADDLAALDRALACTPAANVCPADAAREAAIGCP